MSNLKSTQSILVVIALTVLFSSPVLENSLGLENRTVKHFTCQKKARLVFHFNVVWLIP